MIFVADDCQDYQRAKTEKQAHRLGKDKGELDINDSKNTVQAQSLGRAVIAVPAVSLGSPAFKDRAENTTPNF